MNNVLLNSLIDRPVGLNSANKEAKNRRTSYYNGEKYSLRFKILPTRNLSTDFR